MTHTEVLKTDTSSTEANTEPIDLVDALGYPIIPRHSPDKPYVPRHLGIPQQYFDLVPTGDPEETLQYAREVNEAWVILSLQPGMIPGVPDRDLERLAANHDSLLDRRSHQIDHPGGRAPIDAHYELGSPSIAS